VPAEPPTEIVHSTLRRTASTAEAIADRLRATDPTGADLPVRGDPGFLEIGRGDW
jgi:broad specificity phosphatase PhoE